MAQDENQLIAEYIELNPHKPWRDEARLKDSGIAVWALIGYLPAVGGDVDQVAADYEISREAMDAALAYYRRNKAIIDARIEANTVRESEDILAPATLR